MIVSAQARFGANADHTEMARLCELLAGSELGTSGGRLMRAAWLLSGLLLAPSASHAADPSALWKIVIGPMRAAPGKPS